jgi:hypothetical protein
LCAIVLEKEISMTHKCIGLLLLGAATLFSQTEKDWRSDFQVDKKNLGVKGSNPYFPLTVGYKLSYEHGKDTDTLTVLEETKIIDGVECRVVEDRETKNGQLLEVTRDYYAIDSETNDVYYMGEEVDIYKNGKVTSHEGSWLSGVEGAKFGMMMPAKPKASQRFYQEQAPGVAMDRIEIVSVNESIVTPGGKFEHCVHVVETSPLEKNLHDRKWYASGVGQVRDAEMLLAAYPKK